MRWPTGIEAQVFLPPLEVRLTCLIPRLDLATQRGIGERAVRRDLPDLPEDHSSLAWLFEFHEHLGRALFAGFDQS